MDYHMPVMDGITCTREIRKLESQRGASESQKYSPIHIIAVTADTTKAARDAFMEAGATDMLIKPARVSDLRAAIDKCFRVAP